MDSVTTDIIPWVINYLAQMSYNKKIKWTKYIALKRLEKFYILENLLSSALYISKS